MAINDFYFSTSDQKRQKDRNSSGAKIAHGFCRLLELTRTLCRQSLHCQWLAAEPELKDLGLLFQQHYQSLRKAGDIIANRIQTLGFVVPNHFSQGAWGTEKGDNCSASEMISRLIRNHQACAQQARNVLQIADAEDDDISTNLASQRFAMHDRAVWLLMALPQIKRTTHYVV